MQVVILAGGYGTRISEESGTRPKPMVEVGGKPILWHIMKIYAAHGLKDFIICCGYKGEYIKNYILDYALHNADFTVDLGTGDVQVRRRCEDDWRVTLLDTGEATQTGGRLQRALDHVGNERFCLTYGDGVGDIDIPQLIEFHAQQGVSATLTAVQLPGRFGSFTLGNADTKIRNFREKPQGDGAWINGGFFVLEPRIAEYLDDDNTVWEIEPMSRLARDGQLAAFRHTGFWHPMDTLNDKMKLQQYWDSGRPPWKVW